MKKIFIMIIGILFLLSNPVLGKDCKAPKIKQGMSYKTARNVIIASGFQAPRKPAYGDNDPIKNRYPEIVDCGQGNCAMVFRDAYDNSLRVITYGEIENGLANVTSFEITCS